MAINDASPRRTPRDLVEAIDVLRQRGLEEQRWVEPSRGDGFAERLHFRPRLGCEGQEMPDPALDQLRRDGNDGAVKERPAVATVVPWCRHESHPVGTFRFTRRRLDEGQQRSPLWMLAAQSRRE